MQKSIAVKIAEAELSRLLDQVALLFKPEYGVKITLVARCPNNTEAEVVIGDDNLDEAIKAIERAKTRPAVAGG
jgi:hypothetical protein